MFNFFITLKNYNIKKDFFFTENVFGNIGTLSIRHNLIKKNVKKEII